MFRNVLVGVDGTPSGRDAIALACRLIDPDGTLTLAHVHGRLHPSRGAAPGMHRQEREDSEKLLAEQRAAAEVSAELASIEAISPGRGLHQQAEDQRADLLVVGTCSRGSFGRAMLGDDTRAALNGAPCAVAIAARDYAEHPTPPAKIGVGYDGSPESKAALACARRLAAPTRASIHALRVVSLPTHSSGALYGLAIADTIDAMLKNANEELNELAEVEGSTAYGVAGEELSAFGNGMDLLVVGSRGYGPIKRLVLGSTSAHLEQHARCSLLVLPRDRTDNEPPQAEHAAEPQTPVDAAV